jgi:hypothetical protein
MSLTYYVALPFVKSDDGTVPGQAMECQSESQALTRASAMSRDDPLLGDFLDAVVIKSFGEVPDKFDEL